MHFDFRLPEAVPFRVRDFWDTLRVNRFLSPVWNSPPIRSAHAQSAKAEVFMQVCRRDKSIAVLSCKSLLRYCSDLVALTLIDDGSLSRAERSQIDEHLPAARWLSTSECIPDDAALFHRRKHLLAQYKRPFVLNSKLMYPQAFARSSRVISIDPDTVFFRRPIQLLDWIEGNSTAKALYLHDQARDGRDEAPPQLREILAGLAREIAPPEREWRLRHYYFNSGLLAYRVADLDFDIVERFLIRLQDAPREWKEESLRVWFGPWVIEQTAFMLMYGLMETAAEPFGATYLIGKPSPASDFCHFLRAGLVSPATLRTLHQSLSDLCRSVERQSQAEANRS